MTFIGLSVECVCTQTGDRCVAGTRRIDAFSFAGGLNIWKEKHVVVEDSKSRVIPEVLTLLVCFGGGE